MADFPTSIRIGYRDYFVESWKALDASASERYAECDKASMTIRVREDLPEQIKAECLLHEVIHAAYYNGALEKGDEEERLVLTLGNQLSQVIRDNPQMVAYLQGALGSAPLPVV